ncbi:helix-turn-helix transcriptional regulator [Raoultella terrigena]|uniref:helix-turn-helix transcriptional regulator n=1 Tax=Raoultella terrigena TaxID=577 RepID=UPI00389124C1
MKSQQFTFPTSGNARARHVAYYLGVHISTVWRYAQRSDFPKPHRLTDGVTVFDAAAVRQWNEQRIGGQHA